MIKGEHSFLRRHFPHTVDRPCVKFEASAVLETDFDELKRGDEECLCCACHGPHKSGLERREAVEREELLEHKAPLFVSAKFDSSFGCLGDEWGKDTTVEVADSLASDDSLETAND